MGANNLNTRSYRVCVYSIDKPDTEIWYLLDWPVVYPFRTVNFIRLYHPPIPRGQLFITLIISSVVINYVNICVTIDTFEYSVYIMWCYECVRWIHRSNNTACTVMTIFCRTRNKYLYPGLMIMLCLHVHVNCGVNNVRASTPVMLEYSNFYFHLHAKTRLHP